MINSYRALSVRRIAAGAAGVVILGFPGTGWLANANPAPDVSPVPVKASPTRSEAGPASQGDWLVWSHNNKRKRGWFNAYAQVRTGPPLRLNLRGTQGMTGGVDARRIAYAERTHVGRAWIDRVHTYNLRTGVRRQLPAAADGDGSSDATISGRWIRYSRRTVVPGTASWSSVVLYDRRTHARQRLADGEYRGTSVDPGQVHGRWAVWGENWFEVDESAVVRYDVRTGQVERIEGDDTTFVFQPAVSSDGTMYFLRDHHDVDGNLGPAELVRLPVDGPETVLTQFSSSVSDLFVADASDGSHVVMYQTGPRNRSDLYEIVDSGLEP